LTYAGNETNLASCLDRIEFVKGNIGDSPLVDRLIASSDVVVNFAAESHNDNSLRNPWPFVETNIVGTYTLLEAVRRHGKRYHHISTDEVFGDLALDDVRKFDEGAPYNPSSPYSATKAGSDHLVRAYHHTYRLPTLTTNCSNNYGPRQFPEKLIPLMIVNALAGKALPVYGDGKNVRDWLYVGDHCAAIRTVLARGRPGETYAIGGNAEMNNLEVVHTICGNLSRLVPGRDYERLVTFVADRPGHDRRYAIDPSKIRRELEWAPAETFDTGMRRTVRWYLDNEAWLAAVTSGEYHKWISLNYARASA